jgi:hypothetical protein
VHAYAKEFSLASNCKEFCMNKSEMASKNGWGKRDREREIEIIP